MKKFLILIVSVLCLLFSTGLNAQEKGHWTVNASAVYAGNLSWSKTGEDLATVFAEVIATIMTLGLYTPDNGGYAYTDSHDMPGFVLQGGYQILPWMQLTGDLYYHHYAYEKYVNKEDTVPGQTNVVNRIAFLPGVKFTYLNKGIFHMYSSVAAGMAVNFGKRVENGEQVPLPTQGVKFSAQVVPIGITLGRKHYGFFDLGAGTEYFCFRAGYGYNF